MFDKLTWYLAYKYLTSRQSSGFISFTSAISTLGVAIGIAVLIVVLSVLNGFKEHIEYKLLQNQSHLAINYHNSDNLAEHITNLKQSEKTIEALYPLILDNGLIKANNFILPVNIISEVPLENTSKISGASNSIEISYQLAQNLGLKKQDNIILAAPVIKNSIMGPQPRFKKFRISGFFDPTDHINLANKKYLNKADIIMPYNMALKFFNYPDNYLSALYLYLKQPMQSESIKSSIAGQNIFGENTKITTWQDDSQSLFQAIRIERISIVLLLIIIITVACFNILSGLFIQVAEKQKDIAILRTLGVNKSDIKNIFVLQGVLIAIFGGLFGIIVGSLFTNFLDSFIFWLQQLSLINKQNTFFNAIATHTIAVHVNYVEVLAVFSMSFLLCVMATIIPALKSSKILPLEAFRNE